jgi:25S rRNA (uracil2843-N3)-methyltransferase
MDAGVEVFGERVAGDREAREVFLVRWGVERALVLASLLLGWAEDEEVRRESLLLKSLWEEASLPAVVCLGTGTPELGALAMLLRAMRQNCTEKKGETASSSQLSPDDSSSTGKTDNLSPATTTATQVLIHAPSPDWATETNALHLGLNSAPVLSPYASAAARAAASPFLPSKTLEVHHRPQTTSTEGLGFGIITKTAPGIIIFSYSLIKMRNASLANTIKRLFAVTRDAAKDSMLLVVDEVETAEELVKAEEGEEGKEKKYPLRFVLDLALLGRGVAGTGSSEDSEGRTEGDEEAGGVSAAKWEKMSSHEERVFKPERYSEYPTSLGKVAVQVHLFKRR